MQYTNSLGWDVMAHCANRPTRPNPQLPPNCRPTNKKSRRRNFLLRRGRSFWMSPILEIYIFCCYYVPLSPLFPGVDFDLKNVSQACWLFECLSQWQLGCRCRRNIWIPQILVPSPHILSPVTAHDDDNETLLVKRQNHNVTTGHDIKIWPQTLDSHFGPKIAL